MPGPVVQSPGIPWWADPKGASVLDKPGQGMLRQIVGWLGLDDPAQIMAVGVPVEVGANTGGMLEVLSQKFPRLANAIKAYHGSPHDFERFDSSKIGTGEGGQAYGHGLYFAEKEGIAQYYKENLSRAYTGTPQDFAQKALQAANGDRAVAAQQLKSRVDNLDRAAEIRGHARSLIDAPRFDRIQYDALTQQADALEGGAFATHPKDRELMREAAKVLASGQPLEGRMYEVAIHAHPDQFLDWDKPFSQQAPNVQAALIDLMKSRKFPLDDQGVPLAIRSDPTGGSIHAWVASSLQGSGDNRAGQAAFAEALKARGVPGIKYLDRGSRSAGKGTYNYVVNDDRLVDVLKKYGIVATVAGAGAANQPEQKQ